MRRRAPEAPSADGAARAWSVGEKFRRELFERLTESGHVGIPQDNLLFIRYADTVVMERERIPSFDESIQRRLKKALLQRNTAETARDMSDRLCEELQAAGIPIAPQDQTPVFVFPDFSNIEVHLSSGRSIYANLQPDSLIKRKLESEE